MTRHAYTVLYYTDVNCVTCVKAGSVVIFYCFATVFKIGLLDLQRNLTDRYKLVYW